MTVFNELTERNSAAVQDALTRGCKVCGADAGRICFNFGRYQPLRMRLVHYSRTSA